MENDLLKKLGKNIMLRRKVCKLTQGDLASQTGLGQSHLSKIEKGEKQINFSTLIKIATALKTTPDSLLGEKAEGGILDLDPTILADFNAWCERTGRIASRYHALALWLVQRIAPECIDDALEAMDQGRDAFVRVLSAEQQAEFEAQVQRLRAKLERTPQPLDESHKDAG